MKKIKFIRIVACLFTVLLFANYAFAAEYTLTLLGDLEGGAYFSKAYGVNNLGQVAGVGSILGIDDMKYQVPIYWDSQSGMTQISPQGEAYSINDNGQVVGMTWNNPTYPDGFIWDSVNGIRSIGNLGGYQSFYSTTANDINNSGQIVGSSNSSALNAGEAFIWSSQDGMVGLGTLGGSDSHALAINESGQVAGESNNTSNRSEAFIWSPQDGMVGLGSLLGSSFFSRAYDINDVGQVVGDSVGQYGYEPFIWDSQNGMVGLGSLNESHGRAYGMNNLGQVVGESSGSAFIWDSVNSMVDLNTLVDAGSFQLSIAYDINDNGQVVGLGYGPDGGEAFLLTPTVVPEPISSILFITGGTLLVGKRYMKKIKQNITKTCS